MVSERVEEAGTARLKRWWKEHSQLGELVDAVDAGLTRGSVTAAGEAIAKLSEALEEHFDVEENVYFPLVERLSPRHSDAVRGARLGHLKLIEALEHVRGLIDGGERDAAQRALGLLLDRFRSHEADETRLISELENS